MILGNLDFKSVGNFLEVTFNIETVEDDRNLDLMFEELKYKIK